MTGDDWGLWVNEIGIFASGIAADRWALFTLRCAPGRLAMLGMTPQGGEWHLMCGTREAADEAHALFGEMGFHKAHVKVMRLSACRAKRARRQLALTGGARDAG